MSDLAAIDDYGEVFLKSGLFQNQRCIFAGRRNCCGNAFRLKILQQAFNFRNYIRGTHVLKKLNITAVLLFCKRDELFFRKNYVSLSSDDPRAIQTADPTDEVTRAFFEGDPPTVTHFFPCGSMIMVALRKNAV